MVDESLVGKELPESLHPIQAWQDRLTVVNGLSGRIAGGGHSNDFGGAGRLQPRQWRGQQWDGSRRNHRRPR